MTSAAMTGGGAAAVTAPIHYRFYLVGFAIFTTKSQHKDTDFLTFGVKCDNQSPAPISKQVTNRKGEDSGGPGVYGPYADFFDVTVGPNDTVKVTYAVVNKGDSDTQKVVEGLLKGVSNVLNSQQTDGSNSGLPEPWSSILGGLIGAGAQECADCDGPVINDEINLTAQQLANMTEHGEGVCRREYMGPDPTTAGCRKSHYDFTWKVKRQ